MAAFTNCFLRMLVLGLSAFVVAGTDCGKECALCVYHLLDQQSDFSSLTCSVECKGGLDSQKLRLCQDLLLEEENNILLNADTRQQQGHDTGGTVAADEKGEASRELQLAKKYGGFMKRYGGFMSRRTTSQQPVSDEPEKAGEDSVRLEILKILNAEANPNNEGGSQAIDEVKRYGGFMRRADKGVLKGDVLEAVLGRELSKRYGGFMRRVGRPEWLVDSSKSGGVLKRAWENGSELQKRYGGFMD